MDEFLDKYIFPYTEKYIGRAKTTKDGLPIYSKREDRLNMISHIVGVFIGIGMIVITLLNAHSDMGLAGGIIYGASLVILYLASSVYHGMPPEDVEDKKIFRLLDHCSIFILVAGTCTPCILSLIYGLSDVYEWIFYAAIWLMAIGGIILLCVNLKRFNTIATVMYVLMGFFLVVRADTLSQIMGKTGIHLLLAGGCAYLIGLLFYGLGSKREWMHFIFHLFCLAGSVIHCICIYGFII